MFKDANKNFKYQGKAESAGRSRPTGGGGGGVGVVGGGHGGAGGRVRHAQNNNNKNRVRVQAGDKCVAPGKSKPKKRKSVKQPDYSTLSMDHVEWSDQSYTVKELALQFCDNFPLIVKVVQGYYGEFGTELSIDQVLQIHSYGKQRRVVATDSQQRTISIPYDYPIDVYVPDTREKLKFKDAVRNRAMPLSIEVIKMSQSVELTNVNLVGEALYARKIKEDIFLRANSINGGWLDQREVSLVPSFLNAEFVVAVGMRHATRGEWDDYQNMYALSTRHLLFNLLTGYTGITVDTDAPRPYRGSSGIQFHYGMDDRSPKPAQYYNTSPASPQVYQNMPETKPPQVYENLPPSASNTNQRHDTDHRGLLPKEDRTESLQRNTPSGSQQRTGTNLSASKPDLIKEHTIQNAGRSTSPSSIAPHYGGYSKTRQSTSEHRNESFDPPKDYESQYAYDNHVQIEEAEVHPVPSRSGTPFSEIDENDIPAIFEHVIRVGEETIERERQASALSLANQSTGAERPLDEPVPPPLPSRPSFNKPGVSRAVNVVQPTVQGRDDVEGVYQTSIVSSLRDLRTSRDSFKQSSSNISTMEDVPRNLESLTVADVGQCLILLNMDDHVKTFHRHQIDGKLLADLKENVIVNEFNLTPFSANKLMRFVRGWRPKIS